MDSYGLPEQFEQEVVGHFCSSKWFFSLFNEFIETDLLSSPAAKLAVGTARAIHKDINDSPGAVSVVVNRANTYVNHGKLDVVEYAAMSWYLNSWEALSDQKVVAKELAPILKERGRHMGVMKGIETRRTRASLKDVASYMDKIERIGEYVEARLPLSPDDDSLFASLEKMGNLNRHKTGFDEVDLYIQGGLPQGNAGVIIGRTRGGKSMGLSHIAAYSYATGKTVAHAVISEIPGEIGGARVVAPIIGMGITDLIREPGVARDLWKSYRATHAVGGYRVFDFHSKVTIQEIRETITKFYAQFGVKPDVIIIDYVGVCASSRMPKNANSYAIGEYVMTDVLEWARTDNAWIWTAAQSQRLKENGRASRRVITLEDIADSFNIVKIADMVLTISVCENDMKELEGQLLVAKNRLGPSGQLTGIFPISWDTGLIAPCSLFDDRRKPTWTPTTFSTTVN